jgi:hypothetical protein
VESFFEFIKEKLSGHAIGAILISIGGLFYVCARLVATVVNKATKKSLIEKLKKNPSLAEDYIVNLDIPYKRIEHCSVQFYELMSSYIKLVNRLGNFKIM